MRTAASIRQVLLGGALLCGAACSAQQWGFPRTPVAAVSPDGRFTAFIRNHPEIDPPNQSAWIQRAGATATEVLRIPPDVLWCDRILWSADSRRVAFIVADAIVHVFDPETNESLFSGFAGRRSWDTPPRYILANSSLDHDGGGILFRECERVYVPVPASRQNPRNTRREAQLRNCTPGVRQVQFADVPADRRLN